MYYFAGDLIEEVRKRKLALVELKNTVAGRLEKEPDGIVAELMRWIDIDGMLLKLAMEERGKLNGAVEGLEYTLGLAKRLLELQQEELSRAAAQIDAARTIIERGTEIMDTDQLGKWRGVRSWLEQGPEDYSVDDEDGE